LDLETLASGYGLIEGPRVDAEDNLYFSDVTNGGIYRRSPDGEITTVVPKRRGVGGIALHADGGLVISGRNVCHVKDGQTRIVLERDDVGGFNDLFTDSRGRVLVGSLRSDPFGNGGERVPGDLWRIDTDAVSEVLYGDVGLTNGIGFSPDGTKLYHSDSAARTIIVHDVDADGNVSNRDVFTTVDRGTPDGLAVDEEGRVWTASYGGSCVLRFAPDGNLDATIDVPAEQVTSLCFGGSDRRDIYVVTADNTEDASRAGTIFRTRTDVPGLAPAFARI
jgi:D-xylonolactonase